jgi:hypothetical protein
LNHPVGDKGVAARNQSRKHQHQPGHPTAGVDASGKIVEMPPQALTDGSGLALMVHRVHCCRSPPMIQHLKLLPGAE